MKRTIFCLLALEILKIMFGKQKIGRSTKTNVTTLHEVTHSGDQCFEDKRPIHHENRDV